MWHVPTWGNLHAYKHTFAPAMASAHTVCVARHHKATTTRYQSVCLGNSLSLYLSLLCCTSLFPHADSAEPLKNFYVRRTDSLSCFLRHKQQWETQQAHALKGLIFNFSPCFHVELEEHVTNCKPWGSTQEEEEELADNEWMESRRIKTAPLPIINACFRLYFFLTYKLILFILHAMSRYVVYDTTMKEQFQDLFDQKTLLWQWPLHYCYKPAERSSCLALFV